MKGSYLLMILLLVFYFPCISDTHTSISAGNWCDPYIWDNGVPDIGDDVIINSFITLDVESISLNSLTINSGASLICLGAAIAMSDPETGLPIITYTYTTIFINIGGTFANNGTFEHNYNNRVVFAGSGIVSGIVNFHKLLLTEL